MPTPLHQLTDSWPNDGQTYDAIKMEVADSNGGASNSLLRLRRNGADRFVVGKDGDLTLHGQLEALAGADVSGSLSADSASVSGDVTVGGTISASSFGAQSINGSALKTDTDSNKVPLAALKAEVISALSGALNAADYLGEITSLAQSVPAASGNAGKWYSSAVAGALTDPDVSAITVAVGDRIVSDGASWLKYAAPPTNIPDGSVTTEKLAAIPRSTVETFTEQIPNTLEGGGATPAWGVVDRDTGLYAAWIGADGKLRTARNQSSEVAVLSDLPEDLANYTSNEPMTNGSPPPPFFVADKMTGLLSLWVDENGVARVQGGEIATKPASGIEPIQQINDGLPTASIVGPTGVEVLGVGEDGALTAGDINNSSDHNLIFVDIHGPSNRLRVTHRSPKRGSSAWIQYTFTRYFSSVSTGTWILDSIVKVRRPNSQTLDFSIHAHATATVSGGQVTAVNIFSGNVGRGYVSAPAVTLIGGGGSGAAVTASIDANGSITGFTVTSGGSGYTSAPTVMLSDGQTVPLVYGGMNDIVWSESSTGTSPRYSVDYPAEVVTEGFIGGGHGAEFIAGLQATSPVLYPTIYLDGVPYDMSKNARVVCRHFRMLQRTDLYRNRSPAQVPGGGRAAAITQVKEWIIERGELRFNWNARFNEQFTGTVYAPLYCFRSIYTRLWRDSDMLEAAVPAEYDNATVGNTVPGVTEIRLYSPTEGLASMSIGEAMMWANGQRPYGARINPGIENFFLKTDPDINKVYWTIGSTPVVVGGVTYYRAAANERWFRSYKLQLIP